MSSFSMHSEAERGTTRMGKLRAALQRQQLRASKLGGDDPIEDRDTLVPCRITCLRCNHIYTDTPSHASHKGCPSCGPIAAPVPPPRPETVKSGPPKGPHSEAELTARLAENGIELLMYRGPRAKLTARCTREEHGKDWAIYPAQAAETPYCPYCNPLRFAGKLPREVTR